MPHISWQQGREGFGGGSLAPPSSNPEHEQGAQQGLSPGAKDLWQRQVKLHLLDSSFLTGKELGYEHSG